MSRSAEIFKRMLSRRHWLHRPWIPFLKAVEGGAFLEHSIEGPVLDLACGDGVFTSCVFPGRFEAGFDLFMDDLIKAKAGGTHKGLVQASAYEMPFATDHFGTVISVCAIEHMPELARVLDETARVLRPGGRFIFSVPSVYFGRFLLTPALYSTLGFHEAAGRYADRKNKRSQHYHVLPVEEWKRRLEAAGLELKSHCYILDRRVMLLWSFMGSVFFKPLVYPFRRLKSDALDAVLEKALLRFLGPVVTRGEKTSQREGGYLIVEAVKRRQ